MALQNTDEVTQLTQAVTDQGDGTLALACLGPDHQVPTTEWLRTREELRQTLRAEDIVAFVHEDSPEPALACWLEGLNSEQARVVVDRLSNATTGFDGSSLTWGLASATEDVNNVEDLLERSQTALDYAREQHEFCAVYSPEIIKMPTSDMSWLLIVDPELMVREVVRRGFAAADRRWLTAVGPADTKALLDQCVDFSVVIISTDLGVQSALALADTIQTQCPYAQIALLGSESTKASPWPTLPKPFDLAEFGKRIEKMLHDSRDAKHHEDEIVGPVQLQSETSEIVSGIAKAITNPVTYVAANIDHVEMMLRSGEKPDFERLLHALHEAQEGATRLRAFARELKAFVQCTQSAIPEEFGLADAVRAATSEVRDACGGQYQLTTLSSRFVMMAPQAAFERLCCYGLLALTGGVATDQTLIAVRVEVLAHTVRIVFSDNSGELSAPPHSSHIFALLGHTLADHVGASWERTTEREISLFVEGVEERLDAPSDETIALPQLTDAGDDWAVNVSASG